MISFRRTGPCYTKVKNGQCLANLQGVVCTRQLCCATVGKGWGHPCERCPARLDCELGHLKTNQGQCVGKCRYIPSNSEYFLYSRFDQTSTSARRYRVCARVGNASTPRAHSPASVPTARPGIPKPTRARTKTSARRKGSAPTADA